MKIIEVSNVIAGQIIETREPEGLFLEREPDGTFTAIDNSTRDAWTENFEFESDARDWLLGKSEGFRGWNTFEMSDAQIAKIIERRAAA